MQVKCRSHCLAYAKEFGRKNIVCSLLIAQKLICTSSLPMTYIYIDLPMCLLTHPPLISLSVDFRGYVERLLRAHNLVSYFGFYKDFS